MTPLVPTSKPTLISATKNMSKMSLDNLARRKQGLAQRPEGCASVAIARPSNPVEKRETAIKKDAMVELEVNDAEKIPKKIAKKEHLTEPRPQVTNPVKNKPITAETSEDEKVLTKRKNDAAKQKRLSKKAPDDTKSVNSTGSKRSRSKTPPQPHHFDSPEKHIPWEYGRHRQKSADDAHKMNKVHMHPHQFKTMRKSRSEVNFVGIRSVVSELDKESADGNGKRANNRSTKEILNLNDKKGKKKVKESTELSKTLSERDEKRDERVNLKDQKDGKETIKYNQTARPSGSVRPTSASTNATGRDFRSDTTLGRITDRILSKRPHTPPSPHHHTSTEKTLGVIRPKSAEKVDEARGVKVYRPKTSPQPHHHDAPDKTVAAVTVKLKKEKREVFKHVLVGRVVVDPSDFFFGEVFVSNKLFDEIDGIQSVEIFVCLSDPLLSAEQKLS